MDLQRKKASAKKIRYPVSKSQVKKNKGLTYETKVMKNQNDKLLAEKESFKAQIQEQEDTENQLRSTNQE